MSNNEEKEKVKLFVPPDVPWKKLAGTMLDFTVPVGVEVELDYIFSTVKVFLDVETELEGLPENIRDELERAKDELGEYQLMAGGLGLSPSITIFYNLVPSTSQRGEEESSSIDYPCDRILLVKVSSTLSGLTIGRQYLESYGGSSGEIRETWGFRSLPCVGGVVTVSLECKAGPSGRKPYIRDLYPRRQEMVVDEELQVETLEKASGKVAVTKKWNINGEAGIPILEKIPGGLIKAVKVMGGYSETVAEEQARERSEKLAHITEFKHMHHVLTGYHVGLDKACMTIQPRPFEGEHWELLQGYRLVEGIQDFFLVINVPDDVETLKIRGCLNLGFRDAVKKTQVEAFPPWMPPEFIPSIPIGPSTSFDIEEALRLTFGRINNEIIEAIMSREITPMRTRWEDWKEKYQTLLEISKWIAENFTETHLLTTQVCTEANLQIKEFEIIAKPVYEVSTPIFLDTTVDTSTFSPDVPPFENMSRLNATTTTMFKRIVNSSAIPSEKRMTLEKTRYFKGVVLTDMMRIPRVRTAVESTIQRVKEPTSEKSTTMIRRKPPPKTKSNRTPPTVAGRP